MRRLDQTETERIRISDLIPTRTPRSGTRKTSAPRQTLPQVSRARSRPRNLGYLRAGRVAARRRETLRTALEKNEETPPSPAAKSASLAAHCRTYAARITARSCSSKTSLAGAEQTRRAGAHRTDYAATLRRARSARASTTQTSEDCRPRGARARRTHGGGGRIGRAADRRSGAEIG